MVLIQTLLLICSSFVFYKPFYVNTCVLKISPKIFIDHQHWSDFTFKSLFLHFLSHFNQLCV